MAPSSDQDDSGEAGAPILSVRDASKAFGAVQAVQDVSIDLYGGEVHALVGENGAGKSTLVKLLGGVHQPDGGILAGADGVPLVLTGPADAQAAGIAIIYQEPILFPDLTVEENIFIGRQPLTTGRRVDRRAMRPGSRRTPRRWNTSMTCARMPR